MFHWQRIGRPGELGNRRAEVIANYDKLYGTGNWRLGWDVNGTTIPHDKAMVLYEEAHRKYLMNHRAEPGVKWSSGQIPFHQPELIHKPELRGWWKPGSIESWFQSAQYLEAKEFNLDLSQDLYFVTSNSGKVNSAKRSLGNDINLGQVVLDIFEDLDTIEKIAEHKTRVAYSVLCRPVICDDSGFVIVSMNGYPGTRVGRELKNPQMGIDGFTRLAKDGPLDAYFVMAVTYFDETLEQPKTFISKVDGQLIGETRGDLGKPFIKSPLASAFVITGQTKTIAEMSEEEYNRYASTDRWKALADFLKTKGN